MLLLTSTSDKIQVITGSALAISVHASYVDNASGTITPGRTNTAISTAATTDVVASPAASTQRNVKYLSIRNKDATSSQVVTVQHTDGTTVVELFKCTLLAGEELLFNDGPGFMVYDATGAQKLGQRLGRWLRRTILTSASANHTTGPETTTMMVRGVGGGGGGGGCSSVAAAAAAAGGGGGGSYAEKVFSVSPNTAYAYTCGAAGAGLSGLAGGNGASSTFIVGATTVTAPGGTGGPQGVAVTTLSVYPGGAGGTVPTNGDVNAGGDTGQSGVIVVVATPLGASGNGGFSQFGAGGASRSTVGNGNNAIGFGAGGGGSMTGASAVRTGGNGAAGMWVVDEYA